MATSCAAPSGLRLRVLLRLGAPGGYEPAQLEECFGPPGVDAARFLVRAGLVATNHLERYVRTPAGDAVCPSRRALAGMEASPLVRRERSRPRHSPVADILEEVAAASPEQPLFIPDLAVALGYGSDTSALVSVSRRLVRQGLIVLEKRPKVASTRWVWAIWPVRKEAQA